VGLSCHYIGDEMLYTAIGMGANTLEKPLSFDPNKADIDTVFSLHIDELPAAMQKIKKCWQAIGSPTYPYREGRDLNQRMGLVARQDLYGGDTVDTGSVRFALPCRGISVEHWSLVHGRKLARSVTAGKPVHWSDIDFD
jgi:sialic acid synthase SpsE